MLGAESLIEGVFGGLGYRCGCVYGCSEVCEQRASIIIVQASVRAGYSVVNDQGGKGCGLAICDSWDTGTGLCVMKA